MPARFNINVFDVIYIFKHLKLLLIIVWFVWNMTTQCFHILLSKTLVLHFFLFFFVLSVSTKFQFVIISQYTCPPIPPSNSIVLLLRKNKASKNENINIPTAIYCDKSYVTNTIFVLTINLINCLHRILSFFIKSV